MTPRQKLLVQATFEKAMLEADLVGELFYRRLLMLDPGLRHPFPTDLTQQGRRFMQGLAMAVKYLDNQQEGIRWLQQLAKRHTRHQDHRIVGQALLWALEAGIGGLFTPEVRQAWMAFYQESNKRLLQQEGFTSQARA